MRDRLARVRTRRRRRTRSRARRSSPRSPVSHVGFADSCRPRRPLSHPPRGPSRNLRAWRHGLPASVSGSPACRVPARARSRTSWSPSCRSGATGSSCSTATRCASTCRRASASRRKTATPTSAASASSRALLARNGVVAVTAAISPYRAVRDEVRGWIDNFVEIHVATSLEDCEARDVKGLYAKARAGEIPEFTGVSDPVRAAASTPRCASRPRARRPRSPRPRSSPGSRAAAGLEPSRAIDGEPSARTRHRGAGRACRARRGARVGERGTSNAPLGDQAVARASPTTWAGTPGRDRAAEHGGDPVGRRPRARRATSTRRSRPRPACTPSSVRSTRNPTSPPNAISRERDREAAVAHVVHAGDLAVADELGDELVQRTRRPRDRRPAASRRRAVHDRGPLRTAELGPGRRRARRSCRRRARRGAGRRVARARRSARARRRPGVGWMSAPRDSL